MWGVEGGGGGGAEYARVKGRKRRRRREVALRLDGSKRTVTGWQDGGRGWGRGCKKRRRKKLKERKQGREVQKERTGLSLCFGWNGSQGGI